MNFFTNFLEFDFYFLLLSKGKKNSSSFTEMGGRHISKSGNFYVVYPNNKPTLVRPVKLGPIN